MEAKLIVIRGKANKGEVALSLPTTIGRSRDADLTVAHPMVSRHHCEIFEADGALMVRDLGSLNGTFVNGERVSEAELPPNAEITVGPLTFRAEYEHAGEGDLPALDEVPGEGEVAFEAVDEAGGTEDETRPPDAKERGEAAGAATQEVEPDFTAFEEAVSEESLAADETGKQKAKAAEPEEEVHVSEEGEEEAAGAVEAIEEEEPKPAKKEKQPAAKKPVAKKPAADDFVEMEDLEETAAFTVDLSEEGADEETTANRRAEKPAEPEEAAAEEPPVKEKKGWWPFKRGAAEPEKKAPAAKKESPKKKPVKEEEQEEEEAQEEAPPPKKAPAKKEAAKPVAPAKKKPKRGELDADDLALAAVQGDEEEDTSGKSIGQSEEEDLEDFLKGLQ